MSNTVPLIRNPAVDRVPATLADMAEVDAKAVAATAGIGLAMFYAEKAAGRGPKAIHYGPRCVRYRVADVREWMAQRAATASAVPQAAQATKVRALKAASARQGKPVRPADATR